MIVGKLDFDPFQNLGGHRCGAGAEVKCSFCHMNLSYQSFVLFQDFFLNIAFIFPMRHLTAYEFRELADPELLKTELLNFVTPLSMVGLVIVAHEGINFSVAGEEAELESFKAEIKDRWGFRNLFFQETPCPLRPFKKFRVKVRKEIVTFGVAVEKVRAPYIDPEELKNRLDRGENITLVDVRKRMEYERGSFEVAQPLNMVHFKEFPTLSQKFPEEWKTQTVVTFCTGGIRCEKAATYLKSQGFQSVYQLHGGILNYFQKAGGAHWRGDCFVFDDRENLRPDS